MKKLLKRISVAVLILVTALSCSACFFNEVGGDTYEKAGDSVRPANVAEIKYNVYSSKYSDNVKEASLENAIAEVYTSVVYITNISGKSQSFGCGIVVDVSVTGESENIVYVYTCYHVIEDYESLEVIFPNVPTYVDGEETLYDYGNIDYDSYVFSTANKDVGFVGGDFETDVAVLKIDVSRYAKETSVDGKTVAPINVNKAKITQREYKLGETVFAVGNPTGSLKGTTTSGVVSSVNQNVTVSNIGELTLLQFDTAINAGNSGGGLFNLYGELVGIVNAGSTSYDNIGFAIPYKTSTPTRDDGDSDTGFVNIANKLIETAFNDGENYNYGYVAGRWNLGLNLAFDMYGRPYVSSLTENSVFRNDTSVKSGNYIASVSYEYGGQTYTAMFTATDGSAYKTFNDTYADMKSKLTVGDKIIMVFTSNKTKNTVEVTLTQLIYRDTGMKKSA